MNERRNERIHFSPQALLHVCRGRPRSAQIPTLFFPPHPAPRLPPTKQSPLKREHFEHRGLHVFPGDLRPLPPHFSSTSSFKTDEVTHINHGPPRYSNTCFRFLFCFVFLPLCCLPVCSVCLFVVFSLHVPIVWTAFLLCPWG